MHAFGEWVKPQTSVSCGSLLWLRRSSSSPSDPWLSCALDLIQGFQQNEGQNVYYGLELPTSRKQRDSIQPSKYRDCPQARTQGITPGGGQSSHHEDFPRGAAVYTPARMEIHKWDSPNMISLHADTYLTSLMGRANYTCWSSPKVWWPSQCWCWRMAVTRTGTSNLNYTNM